MELQGNKNFHQIWSVMEKASEGFKSISWRCHAIEMLSVLLALCQGIPPVTGGFPSQMASNIGFNVSFDVNLYKWLNKLSVSSELRHHDAHFETTVMCNDCKSNCLYMPCKQSLVCHILHHLYNPMKPCSCIPSGLLHHYWQLTDSGWKLQHGVWKHGAHWFSVYLTGAFIFWHWSSSGLLPHASIATKSSPVPVGLKVVELINCHSL